MDRAYGAPAGIWTRVRDFLPPFWRREAAILDRTILPELGILRVGYHEQLWFNKNSDSEETIAPPAEAQLGPKSAHGYPQRQADLFWK